MSNNYKYLHSHIFACCLLNEPQNAPILILSIKYSLLATAVQYSLLTTAAQHILLATAVQ
jgi:hypothetical protein